MHSAQELVSQIEALTSLPDVYMRVREQLESPAGSVATVARLVAADPAVMWGRIFLMLLGFLLLMVIGGAEDLTVIY